MAAGRREDTRIAYVTIDGQVQGAFDKTSGGDLDSEEQKYTSAGGHEEALGGRQTTDDLTVSRNFQVGRDDVLLQRFANRRGKADMVVTIQPTDADYNPFGRSLTYLGKLKTIQPPDSDSESNNAAMIGVVLSAGAQVAA